eukprot:6539886-Prymnesium_polylepis.1
MASPALAACRDAMLSPFAAVTLWSPRTGLPRVCITFARGAGIRLGGASASERARERERER